jgi:FAD/FMN-containing dehydrogenase
MRHGHAATNVGRQKTRTDTDRESRFRVTDAILQRRFVLRPESARVVNDVHSGLNETAVSRVVQVESVQELQQVIRTAAAIGQQISIAGGRHAMGGQQFGTGTLLLDMTRMCRVIDLDSERGLILVEAGIQWPQLVTHLLWAGGNQAGQWGIIQKQTGADRLTIGGALAANIHGRGLRLRPIIGDVESFDLVDRTGTVVHCSRTANSELFSLAIGGYGLFGVIARVTLRLTRRHKVERRVSIAEVDDLPALFKERIIDGFEYGDFQFATSPASEAFLRSGVFSCYRPVADDRSIPETQLELSHADWGRLLWLAHVDKSAAFAEYARYYMSTDRQVYWSDTHQLASYADGYHDSIDRRRNARVKGSEMISELYVRRSDLPAFMRTVREAARRHDFDIIYGTIRLIEQDTESLLAWAREPWACIVFNLHVDHCPAGIQKAEHDFRRLIDCAADLGGSYYLTYHRWATRQQIECCHPRLREFLERKREYDSKALFTSDWYEHHIRLLGARDDRSQRAVAS